ncbi:DUF3016 domain-containing protein [Aliiglaciecola litoralis]|uniref:DUF3016 domain-containing protein n=1 Tax=Aliiglaciecola litoralis TaxID=582857 RepID=A0ABP3WRI7_9ALTE
MKVSYLITGAALMLVSAQSQAKAEVEVVWENPKEYRDVQPTMQSRAKFREQTFKQLEEYINELAESLPEGQKLSITVTNLDLAGQVWPSSFVGLGNSGNEVRVVKQIDIPRMSFSYTLTDAQGAVIQQADEVNLKDMSFQDRHNPFFRSENLRYEKNMLRIWFNDEFPELIANNG